MVDTKLQPSFIPKKPVGTGPIKKVRSVNLLSLAGVLVFIITLVLVGLVFGYETYLDARIQNLSTELAEKRKKFRPELISQLTRLDTRIKTARTLLNGHISLAPFFQLLETITLKNVRFTDFEYSMLNGKVIVSMNGRADSFATVVLQSDEFAKQSGMIIDPLFSELNTDEKGTVTFEFTASLDPKLISYREAMLAGSQAPVDILPAGTTTFQGI